MYKDGIERNIYGTITCDTLLGFEDDRYSKPEYVMQFLAGERFNLVSFSTGLWSTMLDAFPCECVNVSRETRMNCRRSPLCRPCPVKQRFIDCLIRMDEKSGESSESLRRKVNGWLNGDVLPKKRDIYLKLCHALGLRTQYMELFPEHYDNLNADRFYTRICVQPPFDLESSTELAHYFALSHPLGKELALGDTYDPVENWHYALALAEKLKKAMSREKSASAYAGLDAGCFTSEEKLLEYAAGVADKPDAGAVSREYFKTFCADYLARKGEEAARRKRGGGTETNRTVGRCDRAQAQLIVNKYLSISPDIEDCGETLSDIIFKSGRVSHAATGSGVPPRRLLLLCLLAENAAPGTGGDPDTVDFDSLRSFKEFFNLINKTLAENNMAMLYPHRQFDFCILYSYFLMKSEMRENLRSTGDLLAIYWNRAARIVGKYA